MAERTTDLLISGRWWLLGLASLLLIGVWQPASQLQMDRRIEQMFPADDPSVESFELLRERFGGNAVAMLVYRDPALLTMEGLERVESYAERARQIEGVLGVLSLAEVDEALNTTRPGRLLGSGLLGRERPPLILEDAGLAKGFRELFEGYTHNQPGTHAAIVTMLDPTMAERHEQTIGQLRELADSLELVDAQATLVGEPVLVAEGFTLVEEDGQRLSTVTIVLLGLTTLVMFRSPRWVLAELLVILWSVQVTRGVSTLIGMRLSMVSSMLTAIVTVIAVASVIHVAVRFGERRRRGDPPQAATRRTLSRVIAPIFWACLTDAAGFAALAVSKVGPVRDFGMMMTLGTGMVLTAVMLILPAVMLCPPHQFRSYPIPADRQIRRFSVKLLLAMRGHRVGLGLATLVLIVITAIGLTRMETETNFIKNFRSGSELARGYAMVEREFGGAGVWDVILPRPMKYDRKYLDSVRELERQLRAIQVETGGKGDGRLTKVLSMADADATAADDRLLSLVTPTVRLTGMRVAMPTFVDALVTPLDKSQEPYLRIMLRSPERLSAESKLGLIDEVSRVVGSHTSSVAWLAMFDNGEPRDTAGKVTGYYVLLARLIDRLLGDQWLCLSIAAGAIFMVMWIALRSLRLAVICMIPNLLPVLAVLGVIGLLGVRVNMGAAMIAAVSIGLTVDGSIHFLTNYVAGRKRGDSKLRAVLHAQRRVGLPVLMATFSLTLGFSVLMASSFVPTITFGVLVTAALAAGTLANLTLLPLLLLK